MKGTLKSLKRNVHHHERTNFNDWSDPKIAPLERLDHLPEESEASTDVESTTLYDKESVISRTELEIELLRKKIKDGYPLLTRNEIRQVRLPFYESLIVNLREDGFVASSEFIKDLVALDDEWHIIQEKDSNMKNRPFLKTSVLVLKTLAEKLIHAELAKIEGDTKEETKAFLSIAIEFSKPDNVEWYWLAEELFEQSIVVGEDQGSGEVDNESKAIAKHLYAAFLLDFLNDPERSKKLVEESMDLSDGRFWSASEICGHKCEPLYLDSCLLLHRVFLQLASKLKCYDLEGAIQFCRNSLHWAKMISCKPAEAKALLQLAMTYLAAKQHGPILSNLENYMKLCIQLEDHEGLCEGHILMAQYHEQINDDKLLLEDLINLLDVARKNDLLKMKALAYRKLALYHLAQGDEEEMQQAAEKAYKYSGQLNNVKDLDSARCLVGIAQAQQIMPHYLSTLIDANNINTIEFEHLILWKNLRIPFFSNVKLHQPEGDDNFNLRERIEIIKAEEFRTVNMAKSAELSSKASSHNTLLHFMSVQSPKQSAGAQSFQKQFRATVRASVSSLKISNSYFSKLKNTKT